MTLSPSGSHANPDSDLRSHRTTPTTAANCATAEAAASGEPSSLERRPLILEKSFPTFRWIARRSSPPSTGFVGGSSRRSHHDLEIFLLDLRRRRILEFVVEALTQPMDQ